MTVTIIETNLTFKSMTTRSSTNRLILHHAAATSCTAEQIHSWHLAKGWSGAGYHFLVRKDANIYRLRPEKYVGAHASGANSDSIGICFEGDFTSETMSDAQAAAGAELVSYLLDKYGISKVQKHSDVCSTACPGTNFPFDNIASGGTSTSSSTSSSSSSSSSSGTLTVDGWIGVKTVKLWQQILGCSTCDGVFSNQYSTYKSILTRIDSDAISYSSSPSGYSPAVKAIQAVVGATQDGYWGPKTVKALQAYVGTTQDGILGQNTAKAVQTKLNKGSF